MDKSEVSQAASISLQQDGDIRAHVRDLTLRALQSRQLEAAEIRAVVRAVGEGVSLGAEQRAGEVKQAISSALSGLDDALAKAAEATHLALRELISQGKDFSDHDLTQALEDLKITEQAFLDTLGEVADAAGSKVKQEFKDAVAHARLSGTDTGASVSAILKELGGRLATSLQAGKSSGQEASKTVSARLAAIASGILSGMAETLREKSEQGQKK